MSDIASLIELDLPTAKPTTRQALPDVAMSDDGPTTLAGVALDDIRAASEARTSAPALSTWTHQVRAGQACDELIAAETAVLQATGLKVDDKGLFYASGTALADIGHESLRRYAEDFAALPSPEEARAAFGAIIADEHRSDVARDLASMRINVAGKLADVTMIGDERTGLHVGETAWKQLREIAKGQNVNAGLHARKSAPRKLRTRTLAGDAHGREVFGIVTDRYVVLDGPQVADLVMTALKSTGLGSGAKMTIAYDAATTRYDVRAVVQAPIDVPAFSGVGRLHQMFARVTGGDDGMCALRGGLGALRIRCLNASLAEVKGAQWRRNHIGNAHEVRHMVADMVAQFGKAAESLRSVWSQAAAHHYLDTDGTQLSVSEALTRLVEHGHIPNGGETTENAVDRYMAAWRAEESPTSAAGILMAVQRAAHESTWRTSWAQADIEEAASRQLYQPVYTLDAVEA